MRDIKFISITENTSISEAINIIDKGHYGTALVVNSQNQLVGIVTDVDIRKGILKNIPLNDTVNKIMYRRPIVARMNDSRDDIFKLMTENGIRQIPIIDNNRVVVGLEIFKDYFVNEKRGNKVIIMAGGFGKRLMPLTKDTPKPLLNVGGKPILETILQNCQRYGFNEVYLMVNYLHEKIEEHVSSFESEMRINLIKEDEPLGTCGSLSHLDTTEFQHDFVVINADLLTNVNFDHLLDFHHSTESIATVCVKEKDFQLPYGVVEMDGHFLSKVVEKPNYTYYVNAGIYVFNPVVFDYIEKSYLNMTDLINKLLEAGNKVGCFPIREFWMDIGHKEDYEKAHDEYRKNFQ